MRKIIISFAIIQLIAVCGFGFSALKATPLTATITSHGDNKCRGGNNGFATVVASGGTAPYTYLWSPLGATTASVFGLSANTYTVTVTDSLHTTATASVTITQPATAPSVSLPGWQYICNGNSVTIPANVTGGTPPYTYYWFPGTNTTSSITVTPSVSTVYQVNVKDANGCGGNYYSTTVSVNPIPAAWFGQNVEDGCQPVCVQFIDKSTLSSGNITKWQWTFGNGDSSGVKSPIYCYPDSGSYTVSLTVTSDSGCSSTRISTNLINVYAHPKAAFTYSVTMGKTVQFTDQSTDGYGIVYWWWRFGDRDTLSILQHPLHTYPWGALYCPELIVMNKHGCTDTVINCLLIASVSNLSNMTDDINVYPNPANDILNVTLDRVEGIVEISLTDVLGRIFYTEHKTISSNYKETINIGSMPSGVYFLTIENNGQKVVKKVSKL